MLEVLKEFKENDLASVNMEVSAFQEKFDAL